jgi:hypothetical protein
MTAWLVAAIPLLIMFFALGMERVEARLRQVAVAEKDVEEFLEQARPDEVRALFRQGIGRALELFRLRRRSHRPSAHSVAVASAPMEGLWADEHAGPMTSDPTVPLWFQEPGVHEPVDPAAETMPLPKVQLPPRRRAS